jgi:hypothetical protein
MVRGYSPLQAAVVDIFYSTSICSFSLTAAVSAEGVLRR